MSSVCAPPIDSPAIAVSARSLRTRYVLSTYGLMSALNSLTKSAVFSPPPAPPNRAVCPSGITTIIGRASPAAIKLSTMKPARPTVDHESSPSNAPCNR